MGFPRIRAIPAAVLAVSLVNVAAGSKTVLPPAQEGEVLDSNNDGTGDVATLADTPLVSLRAQDSYRSIHEFNLGGFEGAALTSAVLTATYGPNNSLDVGPRHFRVVAYTADGVVQTADFSIAGTEVGTFSYSPPYPMSSFSIDATAAVQTLLNTGATYIGFRIEATSNPNPPNWVQNVRLTVQRPAVSGPRNISLTYPNGGQALTAGDPLTVAWTASGLAPAARVVVLIRDGIDGPGSATGIFAFVPGLAFTVGQGQAPLDIPTWLGDGGNYYVELWAMHGDNIVASDFGDAPFSVSGSGAVKRLELDKPNASTSWRAGTPHRITWDAENVDGVVYCGAFDGGVFIANTTSVLPSDGGLTWTIPSRIGDGGDYYIWALQLPPGSLRSGSTMAFDTAGPFEIFGAQPRPTLAVTSPNGGEILTGGGSYSFCWNTDETSVTVRSRLIRGDSSTSSYDFSSLESLTTATSCVNWSPCRYLGGDDFRFRAYMSYPDGLFVADESDGYFTANDVDPPPTITITSPMGGEILYPAGGYQTITWDASDDALASFVNISLITTTPEGTRETSLASHERAVNCGHTGDYCGSYGFSFCPDLDPSAEYRVRVCVYGSNCPYLCDTSEPFTITPYEQLPSLELTSPVGGEVWALGSTRAVTWNAADADGKTVKVMLASINSDSGPTLGSASAAAGTLNVTMPSNPLYASNGWTILLEIRSPEGCLLATARSGPFTLRAFSCGNSFCDPGETMTDCPGDCSPAADFNRDGYVNQADLEHLEQCATGPEVGPPATGCTDADLDRDDDVDGNDFAAWQRCISGSLPADPGCED